MTWPAGVTKKPVPVTNWFFAVFGCFDFGGACVGPLLAGVSSQNFFASWATMLPGGIAK